MKQFVIDKALDLFKYFSDQGSLKGRGVDAKVATVIFIASRLVDRPKPIETILAQTDCTAKELSKCYKKVKVCFP